VTDLEEAWDGLLAVVPPGWYIGRPSYHDERDEWLLYAFDPSERAVVGMLTYADDRDSLLAECEH
jgi:hypothetical protein